MSAAQTAENDQRRDVPPEAAERHWCPRDMGGAACVPEGTYRRCAACGRWWRSVQTYRYWTESEWLPVRWWQWRRRQHIERHLLIPAGRATQ